MDQGRGPPAEPGRQARSRRTPVRATATYTGSEIEAARERLKRQLAEARESAGEWETAARQRARRASVYADEVVHEHAWKSAGVAALVGVLLGCCLASGGRR